MAEIGGDSKDLLSSLREEYGPIKDDTDAVAAKPDLLSSLREEYGPADLSKPRGTLAEMGRQIGAGAVVDIPEMTGKAIQAIAPEGGKVAQFGKELRESAEAREPEWAPDLRDKNEVQKALVQGARAVPASLAPAALAFVPGVGAPLSAAATGALFGGSQYQDTYEKLIQQGLPEAEAKEAALATAATQGGGEIIANKLTAGLLGAGKSVAQKTIGGITGDIAKQAGLKEAAKQFGKAYASELVGEPATEIAQDVGTEAIERAYGAKPSAEYGDIAYQSGTTALAMAAMLGLPGAGGHYAKAKMAEHVDKAIDDPTTPDATRIAAARSIYARAKRDGIQDADSWWQDAQRAILDKSPIRRDTNEIPAETIQPTTPEEPVEQPPEITPEVALETVPEPAPEIPPEAPKPVEPDLDRIKEYVGRQEERWNLMGPDRTKGRSKSLNDASDSLGVRDDSLSAEDQMAAIKARLTEIEDAGKTPGQKVAESIAGKGPISNAAAASPDAITDILAQQEADLMAAEQPSTDTVSVDATTGEIFGSGIQQEQDYYAPEALAQMDDLQLNSLVSAGNLSGSRLSAVQNELLRRKAAGGENAQQVEIPGQNDGRSSTQPGIREEGGRTAVSGEGVQPSRPEIGDSEQAAPQTPISQPVEEPKNGKSENAAPETSTAEKTVAPKEIEDAEKILSALDESLAKEGSAGLQTVPTALRRVAKSLGVYDKTQKPNEMLEAVRAKVTESKQPYAPADTIEEAGEKTLAAQESVPEKAIQEGQYQKGVAQYAGMPIAIENPAGSERSGVSPDGKKWSQVMNDHYGEIVGIEGADGDHLDVFINPNGQETKTAYIIDQIDPKTGTFDEHKAVLGYKTVAEAKAAYLSNYEPGWKGLGSITGMTMPNFRRWLVTEDTTTPVSKKVKVATKQEAAEEKPVEQPVEKPERMYYVVAVNDRTGDKTYMTTVPFNHTEANTIRTKILSKPGRRIQLEDAYIRDSKQNLESSEKAEVAEPQAKRTAETPAQDLSALFDTIGNKSPGERKELIKDHPLKDQINYVEDFGYDIFSELLKSEKNPNGKVERKCP